MSKEALFLFFFLVVVLTSAFWFGANEASAQEIKPILTWQAINFYPSNYQGKAFPTDGTPVAVSVTFVRDGVVVDPGNTEIRWLVDRSLYRRGPGLSEIVLTARGVSGSHLVTAETLVGGKIVQETIIIPKQSPVVTIEAPYPAGLVWAPPAIFRAVPYFFNVASLGDLSFSWAVNNGAVGNESNIMSINADHPAFVPGRSIGVSVTARNIKKTIERGGSAIRINIVE